MLDRIKMLEKKDEFHGQLNKIFQCKTFIMFRLQSMLSSFFFRMVVKMYFYKKTNTSTCYGINKNFFLSKSNA